MSVKENARVQPNTRKPRTITALKREISVATWWKKMVSKGLWLRMTEIRMLESGIYKINAFVTFVGMISKIKVCDVSILAVKSYLSECSALIRMQFGCLSKALIRTPTTKKKFIP
jgi:hypothetical protein